MDKVKGIINSVKEVIYKINPQYLGIVILFIMLAITVLAAIIVNYMMKSKAIRDKYKSMTSASNEQISKSMKDTRIKAFNYEVIEAFIYSNGVAYMTNYKITPVGYMIMKVGFAVLLSIVGFQLSFLGGIIGLILGYFGLDLIFMQSNKSDNKNMLDDIKTIYDTLRIQTKAGVYITSVIADCYLVAHNKRFKDALLRLTSDIAAKNDIEDALEKFRNKFSNEYIDTLVVIIKQSMQTGQAAKMFDDIKNQITDIDAAMMMNEKISIQTKIVIVEVLLYSAIIFVSIYIAVASLQVGLQF